MPRAFPTFCLFALVSTLALAQQPAPTPAPASSPSPSPSSDASAWVKSGIVNGVKGDLEGAIADFDQAIKIDPKYAPAYQCRGHALSLENKLDEAITNYNQAIEIDPKLPEAYYDRGVARGQKADFNGALADFSSAIDLNPKYASAYYNRGHVKYFMGDLDGAIADLNQAIALDPNPPYSYYIRGLARLAKLDREGAGSDFQQSAINGFPDAAFWVWIVKTENGDKGEARSGLSDLMSKPQLFKPDGWPMQIGNFLLEKITQDQLIANAKENTTDKDRLCDAWFYSGMARRFSGDIKGALDCFQQAVATGSKISEVYVEAQRETLSLQKP